MKREPDVDRLLLDQLEVAVRFGVQDRAAAPTGGPEQGSLLQPVQFDADARTVRGQVRERAVECVLFRVRDIGIRIEVVRVLDALAEVAFEVLAQLEVVEPVATLQALPDLEQVGAIDEPGGVGVQFSAPARYTRDPTKIDITGRG